MVMIKLVFAKVNRSMAACLRRRCQVLPIHLPIAIRSLSRVAQGRLDGPSGRYVVDRARPQ